MGENMGVVQLNAGLYLQQNNRKKEPPKGSQNEGMAYFLRVRTAMPSAETAIRATAAATTSLAPVEGVLLVLGLGGGILGGGW